MGSEAGARPHAVLFPYPALGHIRPMMQLAQCLAQRDFIVTFVNTEHNHSLILKAQSSKSSGGRIAEHEGLDIRLVALPDGMAPDETRTATDQLSKLTESINSMHPLLEKLILQKGHEGEPVTCIISDVVSVNAKDIAEKLGIAWAGFWCPSVALARIFYDCEVFETNGDTTPDGFPLDMAKMVAPLPGVPKLRAFELPWLVGNDESIAVLYHTKVKTFAGIAASSSSWILCNSCMELERKVVQNFPQDVTVAPIGPLFAYQFDHQGSTISSRCKDNRSSVGLWEEDNECLQWLDGRLPASVVYISFGSLTMFNQVQLQEMALGLEASEQAFLWVVRPDLMDGTSAVLPEGFLERTRECGRVISWAPQLQVLAHPAVGCFVTHCGWNSTMEGVYHGVPTIAWPYFADQFTDRAYLVEEWKVGRAVEIEGGLVSKEAVVEAVRGVMESEEGQEMRARVQELGSRVRASVQDGGSSKTKLDEFITKMQHLASSRSVVSS